MFGRKGGRATKNGRRVWLLGNDHPGADRSLGWDGSFGNLSDPDALIVDLTGLTDDILQRIDKGNLDQAQVSIRDKILYGGTVVVITRPEFSTLSSRPLAGRPDSPFGGPVRDPYRYSNYHILPINVATTTAQANTVIKAGDKHPFKDYIDAVKDYRFLIDSVTDKIPPGPDGTPPASLRRLPEWDITDNSGRALGLVLEVAESDRYGRLRQSPRPGRLVLLPPPTEPIGEAIGRILPVYGKTAPAGRPVAQPAQREKAAGPAAAKSGPTAGRPPPPPAENVGRGGGVGTAGTAPGGAVGPPAAAGGEGTDAFLSYHHEAKDGVARPLAEGLEKRSVTVWWDSTAMRISDTLSDKIREGLNGARCGVVIVSRGYLDSGWGQTELGAMFLKNFPIFPILHGVTAEEAQEKLPALSGKIMRSWGDSPESIMDEIADAIREGFGGRNGPGASLPGSPLQRRGDSPDTATTPTLAKARPRPWAASGPSPPPGRPAPGAERLLAQRKTLSADSADFARNKRFAGLYSGSLGDDEKPAVLFTAIPHDLGDRCDATSPEFMDWARSTGNVGVDGRQVRVPGTEQGVGVKTLCITERCFGTADKNVALYREFQSSGFLEWGTSYIFFGRNEKGNAELHLCYMAGMFWAFLASARLFYDEIGLDAPFSVILSVRSGRALDLRNIGNEVYDDGRDIRRRFSPDPATMHDNIRLEYRFDSVREMTGERIASAAKRAATDVCNAFGQAAPACYDESGSFSWRLWEELSSRAAGGYRI